MAEPRFLMHTPGGAESCTAAAARRPQSPAAAPVPGLLPGFQAVQTTAWRVLRAAPACGVRCSVARRVGLAHCMVLDASERCRCNDPDVWEAPSAAVLAHEDNGQQCKARPAPPPPPPLSGPITPTVSTQSAVLSWATLS